MSSTYTENVAMLLKPMSEEDTIQPLGCKEMEETFVVWE